MRQIRSISFEYNRNPFVVRAETACRKSPWLDFNQSINDFNGIAADMQD